MQRCGTDFSLPNQLLPATKNHFHSSNIGNIHIWLTVHHNHIGNFPSLKCADFVLQTVDLSCDSSIDTVPVADSERDQWHTDPFSAVLQDGKIYGKGSVDDKAPLVAMMLTAKHFATHKLKGTLVMVAAAEEEVGGQLDTK